MTQITLASIVPELAVTEQGIGYISKRGLAKLCGVNSSIWSRGNIFTQRIDAILLEQGLEGVDFGDKNQPIYVGTPTFNGVDFYDSDDRVIDSVATIVLEYYAFDAGTRCTKKARNIFRTLAAVGLRTMIRESKGWKRSLKTLTREEIIEMCCLPVPTQWQRRFPVEYYTELERLTELKADGHKRPALWGKVTKELIYDYLPDGVYHQVKACREETGGYDKLHQYLSDEGLVLLEEQQKRVLTYMKGAATIDHVKLMLERALNKNYQLVLFPV